MTAHTIPAHAPSDELTADGVLYLIRPICLEDAAREREFICGLSVASRYSRLMYPVREPSATNSRMLGLARWLGFTTRMTLGDTSLLSAQLTLAPAPLQHQPSVG
jgi:hypothetical protein